MPTVQDSPHNATAPSIKFLCPVTFRLACYLMAAQIGSSIGLAADVTFNINLVGQSNPFPPASVTSWSYGNVWGEGNYAYLGSDRPGRGIAIFDISNPSSPQYLTQYAGSEMEDVEVYNGIGYFGSDVSTSSGTGVDIVNLANPASPQPLSRVNSVDGGHNKVHTLSVSEGHLYTVDNSNDAAPDSVKIFNVTNPSNPQFVANVPLGIPAPVAAHEVVVLNDRMYVASKWNGSNTSHGWVSIYDVSNPAAPMLLRQWESGARVHTVWPTDDGRQVIVAEERLDGNLQIWDISNPNQPPDLLVTLNDNCVGQSGNCQPVGVDAYTPHQPFVRGNLMFFTWYEAGMHVFNIADPANPVHVGAFDTRVGGYNPSLGPEHGAWGVYPMLGLDKVLIGDRDRGLIIVDATGVLAPGDYDQNGIVDARDYDTWQASLDTNNSAADGNKNGIVDAADYVIWRKHNGQTVPGGGAFTGWLSVPEPATVHLFAVGIGLFFAPRRVRK